MSTRKPYIEYEAKILTVQPTNRGPCFRVMGSGGGKGGRHSVPLAIIRVDAPNAMEKALEAKRVWETEHRKIGFKRESKHGYGTNVLLAPKGLILGQRFRAKVRRDQCQPDHHHIWGSFATPEEARSEALRYIETGERQPRIKPMHGMYYVTKIVDHKRVIITDPEEIKAEKLRRRAARSEIESKSRTRFNGVRAPQVRVPKPKRVIIPEDVPRTVAPKLPRVKEKRLSCAQLEELKERLLQARRGSKKTSEFITLRSIDAGLVEQYLCEKRISARVVTREQFIHLELTK